MTDPVTNSTGSLFHFRLNLPIEYMPMINDLVRMAYIQFVAQFMFYMTNAAENPMFSVMFVQTVCFLLLGVLVYWLIVHKLFRIETTQFPKAMSASAAAAATAAAATAAAAKPAESEDYDHAAAAPGDEEVVTRAADSEADTE